MNLKEPITTEDVAALFASKSDTAGHHMLWVSKTGDVFLDQIPPHTAPVQYEQRIERRMKFRFETYMAENGYVGLEASKVKNDMDKIRASLVSNWKSGSQGYVESY